MRTLRFFRILAIAGAAIAVITHISLGKDGEKAAADASEIPAPIAEKGALIFSDDKDLRDYSHAGHVCRVAVTPKQIRLGDDKEGIMRNDIFKMRRSDDPAEKAKAGKLLKGRTAICKVPVETKRWHSMRIEIVGDEMRVSLNGEAIGFLKSPGIAHPTKGSMHFTVNGDSMLFDNVRIWAAKELQ